MYRITQFDVPTTISVNSMVFYNQVFGWTFQPSVHPKKWTARTESEENQFFSNPFIRNNTSAQALTKAVSVRNVDQTLFNIKKEGGQIVVPKFAVPGIGWMAYFKDLEQNVMGIIQTDCSADFS